jgi:hypothetical protein
MILPFDELDRKSQANIDAASQLVRGKYYIFDIPVTASAFCTKGHEVWTARVMTFSRGKYLGFRDSLHIFQGIPNERPNDIDESLLDSYFRIIFSGGAVAVLDSDQSVN